MSTRTQIAIEGLQTRIYKHHDGYPEGVLPWLVPFVADFMGHRGWDPEYMLARCLVRGILHTQSEKRPNDYTGWGVSEHVHGDIDYLYTIREDGTIHVEGGEDDYVADPDNLPTDIYAPRDE